jgi:serine/threonine-protein kinase
MLRKIEKYEILDEIGHGGMATVYRARDSRLDRPVALKVLHPHLRGAREARSRFTREAKSVARLRHPNILEIYDNSEEDSDESYIVTELLTGPTLKEFAEATPNIPAEVAACFAIEIARALEHAHTAGIIHRDVKPENVLLHQARCIKLTDFGIAQMVDAQSFTATGQILGSPGHMAPEQVEGKDCDERADIFSLGTVLYYLAVGRLPFFGRNPHQVLRRIMEGDYVDPLRARASIGGRLRGIIVKSLERDPEKRYRNATEIEHDLLAFVGEVGIDDPSELLARYLGDPDAVSEELRATLVGKLTQLGEQASAAGDVPRALDHFNRVLAIDESNERVLELIDRVGRRSRRHGWLIGSGVALGALGLAAIVYVALPTDDTRAANGNGGRTAAASDAGARDAAPRADAGEIVASVRERDGGVGVDARAAIARARDAGRVTIRVSNPPVQLSGPRTVCFNPTPSNVDITVDGLPPRAFGADFRCVDLEPGTHRFRFVGAEDCCEEVSFSRAIAPGTDPLTLAPTLSLRPARVYVITANASEPGTVQLADGPSGRTRTFITVPLDQFRETHRLTIAVPGFAPQTSDVRLVAGRTEEVRVTLEPEGGASP